MFESERDPYLTLSERSVKVCTSVAVWYTSSVSVTVFLIDRAQRATTQHNTTRDTETQRLSAWLIYLGLSRELEDRPRFWLQERGNVGEQLRNKRRENF